MLVCVILGSSYKDWTVQGTVRARLVSTRSDWLLGRKLATCSIRFGLEFKLETVPARPLKMYGKGPSTLWVITICFCPYLYLWRADRDYRD